MVDLHLHTTASDGRATPAELVARSAAAGLTAIAVTDHDTMAACAEVAAASAALGLECVAGIEITALIGHLDVHVLGYFPDPDVPGLRKFLQAQRADRIRRAREIADRLAILDAPIAIDEIISEAGDHAGRAIGRPLIAGALVGAGHARDVSEAFDRFLAEGRPAYVPRVAPSPAGVVRLIVGSGGVASLAHPGLLGRDRLIPELLDAGMEAIEVYHPDHSPDETARYLALARRLGMLVTGGSDFHAAARHGGPAPGSVVLPEAEYRRFRARLYARVPDRPDSASQ